MGLEGLQQGQIGGTLSRHPESPIPQDGGFGTQQQAGSSLDFSSTAATDLAVLHLCTNEAVINFTGPCWDLTKKRASTSEPVPDSPRAGLGSLLSSPLAFPLWLLSPTKLISIAPKVSLAHTADPSSN